MKNIFILTIILSSLFFNAQAQVEETVLLAGKKYTYRDAKGCKDIMKKKIAIKDKILTKQDEPSFIALTNSLDTELNILPQGKNQIGFSFDSKGKVFDVILFTPKQISIEQASKFIKEFKKRAKVNYHQSRLSPSNKNKDFYYSYIVKYNKQ